MNKSIIKFLSVAVMLGAAGCGSASNNSGVEGHWARTNPETGALNHALTVSKFEKCPAYAPAGSDCEKYKDGHFMQVATRYTESDEGLRFTLGGEVVELADQWELVSTEGPDAEKLSSGAQSRWKLYYGKLRERLSEKLSKDQLGKLTQEHWATIAKSETDFSKKVENIRIEVRGNTYVVFDRTNPGVSLSSSTKVGSEDELKSMIAKRSVQFKAEQDAKAKQANDEKARIESEQKAEREKAESDAQAAARADRAKRIENAKLLGRGVFQEALEFIKEELAPAIYRAADQEKEAEFIQAQGKEYLDDVQTAFRLNRVNFAGDALSESWNKAKKIASDRALERANNNKK